MNHLHDFVDPNKVRSIIQFQLIAQFVIGLSLKTLDEMSEDEKARFLHQQMHEKHKGHDSMHAEVNPKRLHHPHHHPTTNHMKLIFVLYF